MARLRIIKGSVFDDIIPRFSTDGKSNVIRFFTHPSLFSSLLCRIFLRPGDLDFSNLFLCVYFFGSRILTQEIVVLLRIINREASAVLSIPIDCRERKTMRME